MVKPPLRTKSIGFKVSEEKYAQLETAAQASGQTLGEWCREAAVLASANGEPQATGPDGTGVQACFGSADLVENVLQQRPIVEPQQLLGRSHPAGTAGRQNHCRRGGIASGHLP